MGEEWVGLGWIEWCSGKWDGNMVGLVECDGIE